MHFSVVQLHQQLENKFLLKMGADRWNNLHAGSRNTGMLRRIEALRPETLNFAALPADSAGTVPPTEWHVWGRSSAETLRHLSTSSERLVPTGPEPSCPGTHSPVPACASALPRKSNYRSAGRPGPQNGDQSEPHDPTGSHLIPLWRRPVRPGQPPGNCHRGKEGSLRRGGSFETRPRRRDRAPSYGEKKNPPLGAKKIFIYILKIHLKIYMK